MNLYLLNTIVRIIRTLLYAVATVARTKKRHYILAGVLIFASIAVIMPQKTSAWTGDLPNCGTTPLAWAYKEKISEKYGDEWNPDVYPKTVVLSFDTEDTYPPGYAGTIYNLQIYYVNGTIEFKQSGSTKTLTTTGTTRVLGVSKDTTSSYFQSDFSATSIATTTNLTNSGSAACILWAKGATYESDWTGKYFAQTPQQQVTDCSSQSGFSKITCEIGNVFDGVADTFVGVGKAIVGGIASLFIPDGDNLSTKITDFGDTITEKLGFLAFPFTFTTELMQTMFDSDNHDEPCTDTYCRISFAQGADFYGAGLELDFTVLNDVAPDLWDFIIGAIRAMTIFAVIMMLRKKYMEIVKQ